MPAHRHAPSLDHENSCSECQRYLIIKFAIGGQSAGHFYIQCIKCKFFHSFPRRDAPPTVAHVPPPPNYVLPSLARPASQSSSRHATPSSSQSNHPPQLLGKRKSSDGGLCTATSQRCGRKASPTCAYSRCKTHCIVEKTGCLAIGHQQERLTARQRQKHCLFAPSRRTSTPPPPSLHLPSLSPRTERVLHTATQPYALPSISLPRDPMADFLQNDAYREQVDDLAQDEELRQLLASPALSTSAVTEDEHDERDETNLALGIALSKRSHAEAASALATLSSSAGVASSSSLAPSFSSLAPVHTSSFSAPAHTSSSSALAHESLSATSALAPSRLTTSTQLKPLYPPGTMPTATQSTRRPRMTTQMSATWMREYRDNTAADAAAIRLTQHKTAVDLRQGRKLTLVFWGLSTACASILCIDLHASPQWPHWALVDSPQLLVRLGLESNIIEQYDERMKLWVEVEVDFRHKLTADGRLFLRIPGALCSDFDTVFSSVTAQPTHIRNNLSRDRRSVRTKGNVPDNFIEISSSDEEGPKTKKRKLSHKLPTVKESDEEVEVVADTRVDDDEDFCASVPLPSPRQLDDDDEDFPASVPFHKQRKRPVLSIAIPTTAPPSVSTSSSTSSSTPSLTFSAPSTPSSMSSAPSSMSSAPSPVGLSENFPTGFYVNEVVAGFRSMRDAALKSLPIADRFQHVFRRPYKKQTYSDALLRWELASESERKQGLAAGTTPKGLWTNWARAIPLKGANARKRL